MKKITLCLGLAILAFCLTTSTVRAGDAKSYQVTGPVLEVTATTITVQKGEEKWQIAGDPATIGKAKVGDKVTIHYQMVATSVDVKAPKK